MIPGQAEPTASWRGAGAALLLVLAAIVAGAPPARSQSDFPNLPAWSYPGAWHHGAGADTIAIRPRTITVRWVRDPAAEARRNFGGYRIYRATNINGVCDTASMVLMRRFSKQVQDSLVTWHFPPINGSTPLADRIATFIDPDSAGRFVKVRRPASDPCRPRCYDSVMVLIPPPGPHDGFRTWYSVSYEALNATFNDLEDMFVPGEIEHRSDLGVGDSPVAIAAGDLDGDGLLDLVTANEASNSLTISPGLAPEFCGTGGFGPAREIATAPGPRAVGVGDLNLDGLPDVLVATRGDQSLSVYLGVGHGDLAPAVTTALTGPPAALGLGDLNSDGTLDVAIAITSPPSVQLLFGDGNGVLASPASPIPGTIPSSITVDGLVVTDLDDNRKQDVVIASAASGMVGFWLGIREGEFGPQVTLPAGEGARAVAVADLTGDHTADLVVANGVANTVSVWFGKGDGTFENPGTFPVGRAPASVAVIDIDADNQPDLAVAGAMAGEVSLLHNAALSDTTSDFGARTILPVSGHPVFVVAGDFNHEGTSDLAVADSSGGLVNVAFGPSNLNHKAGNVSNDVWSPTSDPLAPPDSQFFAHPVAATGGVTANLGRVGVVPNPYRAVEAWNPEGGHELHFINLPRDARILIYTVAGDLVKEIHHSVPPFVAGSPQPPSSPPYDQLRDYETWDLKNGAGQDIVSGIYIYRVEASSFQFQSRFVVIR